MTRIIAVTTVITVWIIFCTGLLALSRAASLGDHAAGIDPERATGPNDFVDNCPRCRDRTPQVQCVLPRGHHGQLCLRCGLIAHDPRRIALRQDHQTPTEREQPS